MSVCHRQAVIYGRTVACRGVSTGRSAQHLESESWLGSLLIVTAGASVEPKRRWDAVSFSANRHV